MSLSQVPIPNDLLLYDPSSAANLTLVKDFFNDMHVRMNLNNKADGGSVEEREAVTSFGGMSFGIYYQLPRENFDQVDRFIITAEDTSAMQSRVSIDFPIDTDKTKDELTIQWINEVILVSKDLILAMGLPFVRNLPPLLGVASEPVNSDPSDEL